MSERPLDIDLTNDTAVRIGVEDEYAPPTDEERKVQRARLAQVLDRGLTVDLLDVKLPDHLDSRWESNDPLSIASAELRGFKVDTQFAERNGLHGTGDGKARIADVVHMIRPKWIKEEEDALKAKRYYDNHIADPRKQKEERDFLAQNQLQPIVGSRVTEVTGSQIEESLTTKGK